MATAKKRDDKQDRIIALIEGDSGCGKSFFVANLKNALIYDTDLGGGLAAYDKRIEKNKSERVELSSYPDILADLRARAKDGKLPENLVIDHITQLQQEANIRHNPKQEADFGRSGNKANSEWRQIREFARTFDCNLFCVAHLKAEYEKEKAVGKIADGAKNVEGDMHIVLRLESSKDEKGRKKYPSTAITIKWRRDPDDERGAVPDSFPFLLDEFEKIHGLNYMRKREAVQFAKTESVKALTEALDFLGEERKAELSSKWLSAAGAEKFDQMTEEQVERCLDFIKKGGVK
jgi:hypothetical protein